MLNNVKIKYDRLNYCSYWKNKINIQQTIFVDEKPFELECIPNRQNTRFYAHRSKKNEIPCVMTEKHSTSLHTFCAINWYGKSEVRFYINDVPKKRGEGTKRVHLSMNTNTTIEIFEKYLVPFLNRTKMESGKIIMDGAVSFFKNSKMDGRK